MNQKHGKLGVLTHSPSPNPPPRTWRSSDPHCSANNHQLAGAGTCVPSLTRTRGPLGTHHPFSLAAPSERAGGGASVCQAHKLAHRSRDYLIIMISRRCLTVMTSCRQVHGPAFRFLSSSSLFDYINVGRFMPRPLLARTARTASWGPAW